MPLSGIGFLKCPTNDETVRTDIKVVSDEAESNKLAALLRASTDTQIMGFDCEWTIGDNNVRQPVALLQLSTSDGLCGLFRLNQLQGAIPHGLKTLLEDPCILKVGVSPLVDAAQLLQDRGLAVKGCVDLRHLSGSEAGLAALAKTHLNVVLVKDKSLRCSNWEADVLSERQVEYAALDALMALRIFWALIGNNPLEVCEQFVDLPYHAKQMSVKPTIKTPCSDTPLVCALNRLKTVKMPLYEAIFIQKPDGSTLVTCSTEKADWYLKRGLAKQVSDNPRTIKLEFAPNIACSNETDKNILYYTQVINNCCVVCGSTTTLRRKNIVPYQYRKHFPVEIKSHESHDILLMCNRCHAEAIRHDLQQGARLQELCHAPSAIPYVLDPKILKLTTAAKTLLVPESETSQQGLAECHSIIVDYIEQMHYDNGVLANIAALNPRIYDPSFITHGKKVVTYYEKNFGGVYPLQSIWRKGFYNKMRPRFLPKYWSVDHGMTQSQRQMVQDLDYLKHIIVPPEGRRISSGHMLS